MITAMITAMTIVQLVRHGQSEANAGGSSTDPATIPLSLRGTRQADQVAVALEAPDLLVSSSFLRAEQSLLPARRRFPAVPWETWPIEEFVYLGSLHGQRTTPEQRRTLAEPFWAAADPLYRDNAESESFTDVWARAHQFIDTLAARSEQRIAVFGHGLFTSVVLWAMFTGALEPDSSAMRYFSQFRKIHPIPNGSITTLYFDQQRQPQYLGTTSTHLHSERQ